MVRSDTHRVSKQDQLDTWYSAWCFPLRYNAFQIVCCSRCACAVNELPSKSPGMCVSASRRTVVNVTHDEGDTKRVETLMT